MDSYIKFAKDVFYDYTTTPLFEVVHYNDREEVAVAFAMMVADDLDNYADSYRVTPTKDGMFHNRKEHEKKQSCCGQFDTVVKCKSERMYFIGYNFGH